MKKGIMAVVALLVVGFAVSFANANCVIEVRGETSRVNMLASLTRAYTVGCDVSSIGFGSEGRTVTLVNKVTGITEKIDISDELLVKLDRYSGNPRAGLQLMDICPTQAGQLKSVWGNVKVQQSVAVQQVFTASSRTMRLLQKGDVCDENVVSGAVPRSAWKSTKGQPVAIFELHRRMHKRADGTEFKAKSLWVANESTAIPMVWNDGTCIRKYQSREFVEADFSSMMSSGETLDQAEFSDIGKKSFGQHNTTGVVLRYATQPTAQVVQKTLPAGSSRVFQVTLPASN